MSIKVDDLKEWFKDGKKQKATHMIVVCDTFDYEDYPVYVHKGENVRRKVAEYSGKNMQTVMEVYDLSMAMNKQFGTGKRVFNY